MIFPTITHIYNCGHWIPHQIAYAGGIDMLGNPSSDSIVTTWEKVRRYDPEVLVIAPCGFTTNRTMQELPLLEQQPGWSELRAVVDGAVFVADFDLFTQPSAATLVDGIELLAACFHPNLFTVPAALQTKIHQIYANSPGVFAFDHGRGTKR